VTAEPVFGPEPLNSDHEVDQFDCGVDSLNQYLKKRALADQAAEKSRTYVVVHGGRVIGYFTVSAGSVEPSDATPRAAKGQGRQPIPAILLGRLAVDSMEQGNHLGEALLLEALKKSMGAADTIGARVVLAHALDERARAFYLKYGFEQSPCHDLHVMILMKDVRKTLGTA
jgi:predicted GNAT family N-acyltransferase